MKLLKPTWVTHEGEPILSVDVHPDGSKFATGGQADSSGLGKIVIWNMEPVREEILENDPNVPKILCQMSNHSGGVNCVRWSGDGRYLASAGDDKVIMIWQMNRHPGMNSNFGRSEISTISESWRVCAVLRGHSQDVLGLSWSSHNIWLASCSVDNTIIVWNALKFPEQVAVLRGHSGIIKGITWDPVGKYLASQADDKTVRIWRTYDWQVEKCVTEPFTECGGTTYALRLDWSPDGEYLVTAHALNNSGPTAQIIDRKGWKTNMDFVGHRKAVTCVRFSPRIMEKIKPDGAKSKEYVACAIGSKDRSVSVWGTYWKRPVLVMHDLFTAPVLDISWSGNGLEMLCSSWDGTVAYFGFSAEELGVPLSHQEKAALHRKLYGKSVLTTDAPACNAIIESTDMFEDRESAKTFATNQNKTSQRSDQSAAADVDAYQRSENSISASSPMKHMNRQIEGRTKEGKRKITPIFLSDFGFHPPAGPQFSTSTETSSIIVEKTDEILPTPAVRQRENSTSQMETLQSTKCQVTEEPVVVQSTATSEAQTPTVRLADDSTPAPVVVNSVVNVEANKPASTFNGDALQRSYAIDGLDEMKKKKDGRGRPRKDKATELTVRSTNLPTVQPSVGGQPTLQMEWNNTFSLPALPSLPNPYTFNIPRVANSTGNDNYSLEFHNHAQTSNSFQFSKLKCYKSGSLVWETILSSPVVAVSGSNIFSCVATDNGMLNLYSTTCGRLYFPSIQLQGPLSLLHASGFFLMTVTTSGRLSVWDISKKRCLVKNESLESLFNGSSADPSVLQALITDQGMPILSLSNEKTFSYVTNMECWMLISSASDVIETLSGQNTQAHNNSSTHSSCYLSATSHKPRPLDQGIKMLRGNPDMQSLASVVYLEKQVAACLALKIHGEFKTWLMSYVRCLIKNGLQIKLRNVCQELLHPLVNRNIFSKKQPVTLLGYDNVELLQEILNAMKNNAQFQRLHDEFQAQLHDLPEIC